ncbi:hypothetical protein SFOMI_3241 [Sphingobium fuliginis]|uniref:Uncharacterized protein n=1 Tax=Sphingobium fuliginis (strain ATCC 27551) TaxID=336203 RepID=A0A292ZIJ9_SPHSA|nr:hypothetical protein SFOMI_3241 [Sphingobium fuliginis]
MQDDRGPNIIEARAAIFIALFVVRIAVEFVQPVDSRLSDSFDPTAVQPFKEALDFWRDARRRAR